MQNITVKRHFKRFAARFLSISLTVTTFASVPVNADTAFADPQGQAGRSQSTRVLKDSRLSPDLSVPPVNANASTLPPALIDTGKLDATGREIYKSYVPLENSTTLHWVYGVKDPQGRFQQFSHRASAYPAMMASDKLEPIPRNRSLVPVANTLTTHQVEVLEIDRRRFMPSQIEKTMSAINAKVSAANQFLKPAERIARIKAEVPDYTGGLMSFYGALGIVAASKLYYAHPSEPLAWQHYTNSLTDPVGVLISMSFMGALYTSMSKVNGFTTPGSVVRSVPAYSKGLSYALGAEIILTYALDPDVDRCIGTTLKPGMPRDLAACDRAYLLFTSENMSLRWLPVISNLMTSTGLYLGAQYVSSLTGLTSFIRGMPLFRGARGNLIGAVLGGLLFIEAQNVATGILKVEKFTTAALLSDWSLSTNKYGGGTSPVEQNLYRNWNKLKANNLVEFQGPSKDTLDKCARADAILRDGYGVGSVERIDYAKQCATEQLDFGGILDRYSEMQLTWRSKIVLWETQSAYAQWQEKILRYHLSINETYDFYMKAIDNILAERKNPAIKGDDPAGFNRNFANMQQDFIKASQLQLPDTSNTWPDVDTQKFSDFLVASMACGPDAEGYFTESKTGIWATVRDFLTDHVTNRLDAHNRLVVNPTGSAVQFFPPRLVNRRGGEAGSVCDFSHRLIHTGISKYDRRTPEKFALPSPLFSKAPSYANLYDYIKNNIREDLIADGQNHFPEWFIKNVGPSVYVVEKQLKQDYKAMLETIYRKNLTDTSYYHCDVTNNADADLTTILKRISLTSTTECGASGTHRLANGVFESLHDEFRLYLGLMIDAERSRMPKTPESAREVDTLIDLGNKGLLAFDKRNYLLTGYKESLETDGEQLKAKINQSVPESQMAMAALINELADAHPELKALDCESVAGSKKSKDVTVRLTCKFLDLINEGEFYGEVLLLTYTESGKVKDFSEFQPVSGATVLSAPHDSN